MSEMVERAAKAIHENSVGKRTPWEQCDLTWQKGLRADARAAIEAMREPTEAMVDAAYEIEESHDPSDIGKAWKAMIDAALK